MCYNTDTLRSFQGYSLLVGTKGIYVLVLFSNRVRSYFTQTRPTSFM